MVSHSATGRSDNTRHCNGLDIIVAGAGPAGLSAAIALHDRGHSVTLYEQAQAPRPIGSGLMLQPPGLAALDTLGCADAISSLGQPIRRLYGVAIPSGRLALDVDYKHARHHRLPVAIHRGALFSTLLDAVRNRGISIHAGFTVQSQARLAPGQKTQLTATDGQRSSPADLVIDALGVNSPLVAASRRELKFGALWTTLDSVPEAALHDDWLEQRYESAQIMLGVLPVGLVPGDQTAKVTLFWSLKRDKFAIWQHQGIGRWKQACVRLWPELEPLLEQIQDPAQMTLARYAHRTLRRPFSDSVIHIGDAAHSTSPQLGQGANMALIDSLALASALDGRDIAKAQKRYAQWRRIHITAYQLLSSAITPAFQSDHHLLAWMRDMLMAPVGNLPVLRGLMARTAAGTFVNPYRRFAPNLPI